MFEDTVEVVIDDTLIKANFCGLEKQMDESRYQVLNLSMTGHNSLDSRNKYVLLPKEHFDL